MFRLKSVYIEDYKNIHNQTFDFSESNGYVALIGLNGSGKSNLLEAISLIFKGLLFDGKSVGFKYEIVYEIDGVVYERKNRVAKRGGVKIAGSDMVYPSSVIACYSGEDTRLWKEAYEKFYMQYFKKAVRDVSYVPTLMYVNKYSWKIAFIALLCSSKENVLRFLHDNLGVNEVSDVTIQIKADDTKREAFKVHLACRWYDRIKQLQDEDIKHELNANVLASTDMMTYGAGNQEDPSRVFQFLYLLSMPEKNKPEGQTIDKLITDIKIKIGDVDFDNLSEGEKKMILIECITLILVDNNSLVLLDEPDAHVHVGNKKKILDAIVQFEGQTVLTTHSPIFTSLIPNLCIYPMEKGGLISAEQRDLIAKMASNNISFIDGACIVSSKHLVLTEGPGDISYLTAAIDACGKTDSKYKKLEKVSFVYIGGASQVDDFEEDVLSKLYDTLESVVFVFDYDSEGREGEKAVQKLIDNGRDKYKILFYNNHFPFVKDVDFYLEDLFDRKAYSIVPLPSITGEPTYAQLKKCGSLAKSVKDKIAKNYKDKTLMPEDYYGFKPFLNQLITVCGL